MNINELGISFNQALVVIAGTVGMYAALLLAVRIFGQRLLATMSAFDLVAVIAFGSVIGRAALADTPRLASGVIALATLLVIQASVGLFRTTAFGQRIVSNPALMLVANGQVLNSNLRRGHITQPELVSHLRQAGIRDLSEVGAAILEPRGTISIIRSGVPISNEILTGVVGEDQRTKP